MSGLEVEKAFFETEGCGDIWIGVTELRRCVAEFTTENKRRPTTETAASTKQGSDDEDEYSTEDEHSTRGGDEAGAGQGIALSKTSTCSESGSEIDDEDDTISLGTEASISASHDPAFVVRTPVAMLEPLPEELAVAVSGHSRAEVIDLVRNFFDDALPAIVTGRPTTAPEDQAWQMSATVFMDYIPLRIELCVHAVGEDTVNVVLRHPSKNDILRFRRVFEFLVAFLQSSGLQVQGLHQFESGGCNQTAARLVDDDFADDLSADDESEFERVEHLLASLESRNAQEREHIFQCLARWAVSAPASHVVLAQGLANHAEDIETMLFRQPLAPVAEMYPLAALLKCLACGGSMEARCILSDSIFLNVDKAVAELPRLVASELAQASGSLREVAFV